MVDLKKTSNSNKPHAGGSSGTHETGNVGGKKLRHKQAEANSNTQRARTTPENKDVKNKSVLERGVNTLVKHGDKFQDNVLDPASALVGSTAGKVFYETKSLFEKLGKLIQKGKKELMDQLNSLSETLSSIGNKLTKQEAKNVENLTQNLQDTSKTVETLEQALEVAKTITQATDPSNQASNKQVQENVFDINKLFPGIVISTEDSGNLEESVKGLKNANPQDDKSFAKAAEKVHTQATTVATKITDKALENMQALGKKAEELKSQLEATHPEAQNVSQEAPQPNPVASNIPKPPPLPSASQKSTFKKPASEAPATENIPPPPSPKKQSNLPPATRDLFSSIEGFSKNALKRTPPPEANTASAQADPDDPRNKIMARRGAMAGNKAAKNMPGQRKQGGVVDNPQSTQPTQPTIAKQPRAIPLDENGIPIAPPPPGAKPSPSKVVKKPATNNNNKPVASTPGGLSPLDMNIKTNPNARSNPIVDVPDQDEEDWN